jgi:hypothetical protein
MNTLEDIADKHHHLVEAGLQCRVPVQAAGRRNVDTICIMRWA